MEAILVLATLLLVSALASRYGADSRDGRDWRPLPPVPRPRTPAPSELADPARPRPWID